MLVSVSLLPGLLVCCATGLGAAAPPPCDPLPYEVFWNVGGPTPAGLDLAKFLIFPGNFTQTGDGCSTPGCKPWSQGRFPVISNSGQPVYGGVPQNSNLTAHLEALRESVEAWLPDAGWSGNAVLDFEQWTTVWDLDDGTGGWHDLRYPLFSLVLERRARPDEGPVELYENAKRSFEAAATTFFVETLNALQKARPKVRSLLQNRLPLCWNSFSLGRRGYNI